jgi:N-acetylglucosamine kinase-like BadF-type ATPase
LFLGVDGGNSGTRALVMDAAGTVLGYGSGGNANHQGQGYDRALHHVATASQEACRAAGITVGEIEAAHFALAGDDVEDDHVRLSAGLEAAMPGLRFTLSNDVWAGLRAGSMSGIGVAVNCGSGCGTVGRNAQGEQVMLPDLGYEFGDAGGGNQIAIDTMRAVIRAWQGRGEPTMLTRMILDLTGQPDVGALYLAMYRGRVTRDTRRAATRLVFQAAALGDAVAIGILRRIGDELGVAGAAVARRLGMQDVAFPFVLTGGAFRTLASPLAEAAIARLRQTAPRCVPTLPLLMPVAGAGLLALDAAARRVTQDHYERLRAQGYGWHSQ